ncbi:gpmA, partial [Symbiodinium microadriaticum]
MGKKAKAILSRAKGGLGKRTPGVFKIVFLRHGESDWNVKNIFTGWADVDLSERGRCEAVEAGRMLLDEGFRFDIVFTSVLRRAVRTAWTALAESGNFAMPVINSWRLNERHYGGLQGLNKAETAAKHGEKQVKIWRRSYDIPPPAISASDPRHPSNDPMYRNVPKTALPGAESLAMTVDRVMPFWNDTIAPCVMAGKNVLVAAHGNSLRAICKYLEGMKETDVMDFNIPTGVPLVYELDANLRVMQKYYLLDDAAVKAKIEGVANQGK